MTEHVRVAIVGAAIAGCATAWHLARFGWRDILLIDQGDFPRTGGSTSHAPGIVFQTNPSPMMAAFARETVAFYGELRHDGRAVFADVGSIELATGEERHRYLTRRIDFAEAAGLTGMALLPPDAVAEQHPLVDPAAILGGYWVPSDGYIDPPAACAAAMAELETAGAARLWANTEVTGIVRTDERVHGLVTPRGAVEADIVVLAGGIWGPKLGRMAGVSIPLMPVDHQSLRVGPIPALENYKGAWGVQPALREQDVPASIRQWYDHILIGNYRREPRLVEPEDILAPTDAPVMPSQIDFRPEEGDGARAALSTAIPCLRDAPLDGGLNGMFCFTPDGNPILGPTSLEGLWLCEAVWLTHAGGAAKSVAEWIVHGAPERDISAASWSRFNERQHDPAYVRRQALHQYRTVYDIPAETEPARESA